MPNRYLPEDADLPAFAAELVRLRKANALTQQRLCEALELIAGRKVTRPAVAQWEAGEHWPTVENIRALELVLQAPSTLAALAGIPAATMVDFDRRLRRIEEHLGPSEVREGG